MFRDILSKGIVMKKSLGQTVAIATLLALSLICVDMYVQQSEADSYTLIITHFDVYF